MGDDYLKRRLTAALAIGAELVVEETGYQLRGDANAVDWQRNYSLDTFLAKANPLSLKGWGVDSNDIYTNGLAHPLSGAGFYLTAREFAHLSLTESTIAAIIAAHGWEWLGEFKEKGSYPDTAFTGPGGLAIGEAIHRIKRSFSLSGSERHGLVSLGMRQGLDVAVGIDVKNAPKEMAELYARVSTNGAALDDLMFYARTTLGGYAKGGVFLGSKISYDFEQKQGDKFAVMNLLGATADIRMYRDGFMFRATFDISGDYAQVSSYSYEDWRAKNPDEIVQAVLEAQSYYNGVGASARAKVTASYKNVDLNLHADVNAVHSLNGIDRDQDKITHDVVLSDTRQRAELSVGYTYKHVRASADLSYRRRHSSVEGNYATHSDKSVMFRLGWAF